MICNFDLKSCLLEAKETLLFDQGWPTILAYDQATGRWSVHQFKSLNDGDMISDSPKIVLLCQVLPDALNHVLDGDVFPLFLAAIQNYARINLVPAGVLSFWHFLPPSEVNPVFPKPTIN
jgi:hypothetical protein